MAPWGIYNLLRSHFASSKKALGSKNLRKIRNEVRDTWSRSHQVCTCDDNSRREYLVKIWYRLQNIEQVRRSGRYLSISSVQRGSKSYKTRLVFCLNFTHHNNCVESTRFYSEMKIAHERECSKSTICYPKFDFVGERFRVTSF